MPEGRLTITRAEVAHALTEFRTVQLLEPFMKRDLSLGEAAKELGVKLPLLLYHVNKFLAFGLLEVARTEPRAGRPVKYYRSTATTFFVPYQLTSSETLAQLLEELIAPTERRFHREAAYTLQTLDPDWGLNISAHPDEGVSYALAPRTTEYIPEAVSRMLEPDAPALFVVNGTFELEFETAKALQKELSDLFSRYNKKQKPGSQHYAYRLGLTPMQDDALT